MAIETSPSLVYLNIDGPEDPTRATLTLAAAIAARNEASDARIIVALLGKGVQLIDPKTAASIPVTGARTTKWTNIEEMIQTALAIKPPVEIHCWEPCYQAPGGRVFTLDDVKKRGFYNMTPQDFAKFTLRAKQVISF